MPELTKLAETGLLGLLLAIAIGAIVLLYRDNKELSKKILELYETRISDLRESRDVILEPMKSIKQTVELVLQSVVKK